MSTKISYAELEAKYAALAAEFQEYKNTHTSLVRLHNGAALELKEARNQKPSAWILPARYGSTLSFQEPNKPIDWDDEMGEWYCDPLYASPVPARELTDKECAIITSEFAHVRSDDMLGIARAIERYLKEKS